MAACGGAAICLLAHLRRSGSSWIVNEASRISMACEDAIEAYGPDADALPRIVDQAFDEVDRIDRLMSHYDGEAPFARQPRGRSPSGHRRTGIVRLHRRRDAVSPRLRRRVRHHRRSPDEGVGLLPGEGRVPRMTSSPQRGITSAAPT